jgi:hypothetical protein
MDGRRFRVPKYPPRDLTLDPRAYPPDFDIEDDKARRKLKLAEEMARIKRMERAAKQEKAYDEFARMYPPPLTGEEELRAWKRAVERYVKAADSADDSNRQRVATLIYAEEVGRYSSLTTPPKGVKPEPEPEPPGPLDDVKKRFGGLDF